MEQKKNPEADLEKKRALRLGMGLLIAVSVVLIAFEWKSYDRVDYDLGQVEVEEVEEELIPVTEQEVKPPPPPPPPAPEIEIVEDDVEVEEEVEIMDVEADMETEIEIVEAPPAEEEPEEPEIFTIVEDMPQYPGGDAALMKFIQSNIKYPQIAKENGISGVVYVSFVVDEKGDVNNVKVVRGVDPFLDKEAVRVVKLLDGYSPGKQRGKPVRVQFTLPIRFQLN